MIDGSEKRNRQLAFEFRLRMFVKSAVSQNDIILEMVKQDDVHFHANVTIAIPPSI